MIEERYDKTRKEIIRDRLIEFGLMLLCLPYHFIMIVSIIAGLKFLFE